MLSARYLHLHEALGLGPMWLKRGAVVLPSATLPGSPTQIRPQKQTVLSIPQRPSEQHTGQARLKTMKVLETAAVHTRKPMPETETPLRCFRRHRPRSRRFGHNQTCRRQPVPADRGYGLRATVPRQSGCPA